MDWGAFALGIAVGFVAAGVLAFGAYVWLLTKMWEGWG